MNIRLQGVLGRLVVGANRRGVMLVTVLVAAFTGFGLCTATASTDDGAVLCSGYSECSTNGFSTHDYQYYASQSWWRMYPGDNCTNYAAYVESQAFGVPEPSVELGNGGQWGYRAAEAGIPVDQTPSVGSVAVWDGGATGMGADGHVAVVEAVAPDGSYIEVSQSGMGTTDDGFNWELIYRSGSSWEAWSNSFIHFSGTAVPGTVPTQAGGSVAGAHLMLAGA